MTESNAVLFIINLAVAILCGGLLLIIPFLTRKSYLFGVKIPLEEHDCPEAKSMKKRYMLVCVAGTMVILALYAAQYMVFPNITLIAAMYFPLLFVAVQMASYIPNWKKALVLKKERGWKVSGSVFAETKTSHSRGNLSELPWLWYVISLVLIVVSVVVVLGKYPSLPDRIPTHWDASMQPDGWSDKTILGVMMLPLVNLGMLALMWVVGIWFVKAKLQIDPQDPALSFTQHRIYRRRMGHSIGFMALALVVMFVLLGFMSIWPDFKIPFWLVLALPLVPTVFLVLVSVRSGQGGCRIKPDMIIEDAVALQGQKVVLADSHGRSDDRHWALGMFYHNPDDPASIVEDRFGNNLGFNYSRLPVKVGVISAGLAFVVGYTWFTIWLCSTL